MVMAALTALKSTNFVLDIYFLWLFDCNELCGSRSEPLPNGILTSAGKISRRANLPILASPGEPKFWQICHNARQGRRGLFPKPSGQQKETTRGRVSNGSKLQAAMLRARHS